MKIFIGADHRGYRLKNKIAIHLGREGHEVVDLGTHDPEKSCDYPKFSFGVAQHVAETPGSRGILICMTGIGHSIAANKVAGAYAALCYNKRAAVLSRQHNNANILVVGAKFVPAKEIMGLIRVWLKTEFAGGRHVRRVGQIKRTERRTMEGKGRRKKGKGKR